MVSLVVRTVNWLGDLSVHWIYTPQGMLRYVPQGKAWRECELHVDLQQENGPTLGLKSLCPLNVVFVRIHCQLWSSPPSLSLQGSTAPRLTRYRKSAEH